MYFFLDAFVPFFSRQEMHEKGEKQKRDQNGTNDKEQNEEEEQRGLKIKNTLAQ